VNDIPLQFQRDAAYSIRGIKLNVAAGNLIGLAFKDAFGNPISESDVFISPVAYQSNPSAALPGSTVVIFEPELEMSAGAAMYISFKNLGGTTSTLALSVVFWGIKKYPAGARMQDCERPLRHNRALVELEACRLP